MNKKYEKYLKRISQDSFDTSRSFNIRVNGKGIERKITDNVNIIAKKDNQGIDIYVKEDTKYDLVYIPVIIDQSGLEDIVYNDFYIGKNANVLVVAGCGIFSNCHKTSKHNGIHRFYLDENAKVKYIENHYGELTTGENIMNPITEIYLKKGSSFDMNTTQIGGISKTIRSTKSILQENTTLIIHEKIKTDKQDEAETIFDVELQGNNSHCHVSSRAIASGSSKQKFISKIVGNTKCTARSECDAIIQEHANVVAEPQIVANDANANLIHEATIGKIAGEQLLKLMTLGLTKKEAEQKIITGFLK